MEGSLERFEVEPGGLGGPGCKARRPWNLRKLFDREKKLRGGEAGLQEVLKCIKPSEFQVRRGGAGQLCCNVSVQDSQLARLAPFSWTDFVEFIRAERSGRGRQPRRVTQ